MKGIILVPIILGSVLLVIGGALFAVGIKNNKPLERVTNTYDLDNTLTDFDVKVGTSHVEFKVSEDNSYKVVCEETVKDVHEVTFTESKLTIRQTDLRKWHEKIFNFNYKPSKVTIYLPSGTSYNEAKIIASTGSVTIPHDYTFNLLNASLSTGSINVKSNVTNNVDITVSTGSINLSDMNALNIKAKSSTGSIRLTNVEVSELLNLEASTGKVVLKDVTAKNLNAKCSNGDVNLENTIIEEHIEINTSTGDVKFKNSDADTLKIKTDTGDVRGSLLTSKIFYAKSKTGRVDVPKTTTGGLCEIESHTGNIVITIVYEV